LARRFLVAGSFRIPRIMCGIGLAPQLKVRFTIVKRGSFKLV